jgi:hypothetical protein
MNYAQARQRESDGRWDWTVRNDDRIWASGPCADHADGHATAEEAERHYWEWEHDPTTYHVGEYAGAQHECLACKTWTSSYVRLRDGYTTFVLCPDHQDRASVDQVHPFKAGMQHIYS